MNNKLSSELQRIPVHGLILFFEGHVFKVLGNVLVPSCIQHRFLIRVRVVRRLVGEIGEMRAEFYSLLSLSTELRLYCRTRYDASMLKPAYRRSMIGLG